MSIHTRIRLERAFCVTCLFLCTTLPTAAGTIGLRWSPSADATGYRVHYGTVSGQYTTTVDAGGNTATVLADLEDCTRYYFAVSAYNAAGESGYSQEASSLARPAVEVAAPSRAEQGRQLDVTFSGANFDQGASVVFSGNGIQVSGVTVNSCQQLVVSLALSETASVGSADVEVTNPSGAHETMAALFTVQPGAAPGVQETNPADGVAGVSTNVHPSAQFDEPILATSVSASTVRLVDQADQPVAQAAGSPALSGDGTTVTMVPESPLTPGDTYRIQLVGGASGLRDLAGHPMTSTYTQTDGFTVASVLAFDAELGALVSPVGVGAGAGAFGGAWIETPAGITGNAAAPAGTATYGVAIPRDGTWYLWVRIYGPDGGSDSWFESMDGAPRQAIEATSTQNWQWVAGRSHVLSAGLHDLELGGREGGARADRILLTDDPDLVPVEQPGADAAPPATVSSFTATPTDTRITLAWVNPADADFVRTVIRHRTDGRFPASPLDGFAVAEQAGTPGSSGGHIHQGLTNGAAYHYSAFALDAAGNVSAGATAHAIAGVPPAPPDPPTDVEVH